MQPNLTFHSPIPKVTRRTRKPRTPDFPGLFQELRSKLNRTTFVGLKISDLSNQYNLNNRFIEHLTSKGFLDRERLSWNQFQFRLNDRFDSLTVDRLIKVYDRFKEEDAIKARERSKVSKQKPTETSVLKSVSSRPDATVLLAVEEPQPIIQTELPRNGAPLFSIFYQELRTWLNTHSFTTLNVQDIHRRNHLENRFLRFLCEKGFILRRNGKAKGRRQEFQLTPQFGELSLDHLQELYKQHLLFLRDEKEVRLIESAQQDEIAAKLQLATEQERKMEAPVNIPLSRVVDPNSDWVPPTFTITAYPGVEATESETKPLKSFSFNWTIDDQSYSIELKVDGPQGEDYEPILRKGLAFLGLSC